MRTITVLFASLVTFSSAFVLNSQYASAFFVSIDASTSASTPRAITTPPDQKSITTGQLSQTSTSRTLSSTHVLSCTPGVNCPAGIAASAQSAFQGTASLGTLSGLVSGSTSESGTTGFGPSDYAASATIKWQDTFTITREGDFRATLTLDSSVNVNWPPGFSCPVGGPGVGLVTLSLSGPVLLNLSESTCMPPPTRTVSGTFHGIPGQQYVIGGTLGVTTNGHLDLGQFLPDLTSVAISSQVDASHTGIFKLDPITPGAAYTTESGASYTVSIPNQAPIANAGIDQTVHVGRTVSLDGTGSADPDGNTPLAFAWTLVSKPSASNAQIINPLSSMPSFFADANGDYVFSLVVTDSIGASSTPAQVKVTTTNSNPVADAGPDQAVVAIGTTVQLNGGTSYDPDGDTISYNWTLSQVPSRSAASLSNSSAANPSFTADVNGNYLATLMVTDQHGAVSQADGVAISFTNVKPVANAGGNQAALVGQIVQINASASSDANGDALSYSWTLQSKPTGSATALSNVAGRTTNFTADQAGTFIVSLVVNDGLVNSDPDTITIVVTSRQDQLAQLLRQAITIINGMNVTVFKNRNMPNTLTNKINAALQDIDKQRYQDALDKLQEDILGKSDGCAGVMGVPGKNDWVLDCEAQRQLSGPIVQAITLLKTLIQ